MQSHLTTYLGCGLLTHCSSMTSFLFRPVLWLTALEHNDLSYKTHTSPCSSAPLPISFNAVARKTHSFLSFSNNHLLLHIPSLHPRLQHNRRSPSSVTLHPGMTQTLLSPILPPRLRSSPHSLPLTLETPPLLSNSPLLSRLL